MLVKIAVALEGTLEHGAPSLYKNKRTVMGIRTFRLYFYFIVGVPCFEVPVP